MRALLDVDGENDWNGRLALLGHLSVTKAGGKGVLLICKWQMEIHISMTTPCQQACTSREHSGVQSSLLDKRTMLRAFQHKLQY